MALRKQIGIDLGTANVLVYVKGKGIVLQEPSVVAVDKNNGKLLAVGEEAKIMLGRTPRNIVAIRPLKDGVIAEFDITEQMLRYFIGKVIGRSGLFRPKVVVGIPSGATEVERRAVYQAVIAAGGSAPIVVEEPMAAAIGAGIDVMKPTGNLVVDIGGGTTDIAVISLGGIVTSHSIKIAGDRIDEAIVRHMHSKHHMLIGMRTAEDLKRKIGSAHPGVEVLEAEVRGRDLDTGLPKTVVVDSEEIRITYAKYIEAIMTAILAVMEKTPPELVSDICDAGIYITGGGAKMRGLEQLINEKLPDVPVHITENAEECVALGTGLILDNPGLAARPASRFEHILKDHYDTETSSEDFIE
ncbi:rod shape-determining protein [Acetobacterium bakii]|uniref:rod shape-determining protein n=1 Tax=Acetobacterium bakii TaxID=52689 RepID=UPI0009F9C093|nr:rod shape-determining protein [Acetobacterium bakii]